MRRCDAPSQRKGPGFVPLRPFPLSSQAPGTATSAGGASAAPLSSAPQAAAQDAASAQRLAAAALVISMSAAAAPVLLKRKGFMLPRPACPLIVKHEGKAGLQVLPPRTEAPSMRAAEHDEGEMRSETEESTPTTPAPRIGFLQPQRRAPLALSMNASIVASRQAAAHENKDEEPVYLEVFFTKFSKKKHKVRSFSPS